MPTFVIHQMGRPPKTATFDKDVIRAGRAAENDLVLPAPSVSREHAVFNRDGEGNWHVTCASQTNPLFVGGKLIGASAAVTEGTEILVGTEQLLIFTRNESTAGVYLGPQGVFHQFECERCQWTGMVSTVIHEPTCPRCGEAGLSQVQEYDHDREAGSPTVVHGTETVNARAVKASLDAIKAAKQSHIERVDDVTEGHHSRVLTEQDTIFLGKDPDFAFYVAGFTLGKGVRIAWNGEAYALKSLLLFPRVKINGRPAKRAILRAGDVIAVGRNRFRFVVG